MDHPPQPVNDERSADASSEEVIDILDQVERQFDKLRSTQAARTERQSALQEQSSELQQREQELQDQMARLTQEREHLADEQSRLDREERVREDLEHSQQARRQLKDRVTRLEDELGALRGQLERSRGDRDRESTDLEHRLQDTRRRLEEADEKIGRLTSLLKEQQPDLEEGAAAIARAQQQAKEIEQLTAKLAEAKLGSQIDDLKRKDQRIKELTEALHQSRGQTGAAIHVDTLERQASAAQQQVDQLRVELERSRIDGEEARRQLEEHVAAHGTAKNADERAAAQFAVERDELKHRICELERSLEETRAEATRQAGEVDQREIGLTRLDRRLRQRRDRLARVRRRLREQRRVHSAVTTTSATSTTPVGSSVVTPARTDPGAPIRELRGLHAEQRKIVEERAKLKSVEEKMARRWARPRAMATVAWMLIVIGMNAGGAWLVAKFTVPTRAVATAIVKASSVGGGVPSAANLQSWKRVQEGALADSRFHDALAVRFTELNFDGLGSAAAVANNLDLSASFERPGLLKLFVSGSDPQRARELLDVVATEIITWTKDSGAEVPGLRSVTTGERTENGRTVYATARVLSSGDERTMRAVQIAGLTTPLCLLLVFACYRRLLRGSRVFDEELG